LEIYAGDTCESFFLERTSLLSLSNFQKFKSDSDAVAVWQTIDNEIKGRCASVLSNEIEWNVVRYFKGLDSVKGFHMTGLKWAVLLLEGAEEIVPRLGC